MRLTQVESPGCEPVSLQDAKVFLKVETNADDRLIERLLQVSRTLVEEFTEKALILQTWRVEYPAQPSTQESFISRGSSGKQDSFLLPRSPFIELVGRPILLVAQIAR